FVGSSATAAATVTTPVNFIAGQPVALAFAGSPSTPAADPFTLVVTIVDANGNVCPDNREVALCLPNEPNSPNTPCSKLTESPAGVVPRAFVHQNRFGFTNANVNTIVVARNGVALFPGLSNSSSGTYRVGAIAKGLTPGVGTYTIVGNTATQVRWKVLLNGSGRAATTTNNPAPLVTGGTFGYNLIVYACDVFGNITSRFRDNGSHPIQLSGNGLTLTGAGTVGNATPSINLDANGMAVFPNIGTSSPAAATLVTITATDLANGAGGTSAFTLFSAMSNQFEVVATNAPCAIQLTNVPASLTAGTASPSITASIFDSAGNVATAPVGGVPFTFVLLNDEGFLIQQGFTIPAGMSSTTFAVTLLGFNAQGGNGTPLTFNSTFNDGTNTVRLREQVLATQVQLIPGPATSIALTQTPLRGYANGSLPPRLGVGQNVAPSVEVTARDAFGNVATGFTGTAALTITPTTTGTGTFNGGGSTSLAGTAVNGRATFAFNVNGAVAASVPDTYTLNANTGTIANVSNPFNLIVVAPTDVTQTLNPARLVFLNAPQSNTAGSSVLPTDNTNEIRVQVQDAFGTPILVAGTTITVDGLGSSGTTYAPNGTSIGNGGTNIGSSWGPTTAMTDAQGIARFPNLNNPVTGANVVLVATANNVNNAVCVPFDIVPGAPNSESFLKDVQGTLSRSGEIIGPVGPGGTGRPVLRITDSAGNVVTDFTGSFTASIELPAPTNAGILSGTLNVPCVSGIAVFNDLTITNQGGGSGAIVSPYQLRFKSTGITNSNGLTSTPFGVQNP
ncbi:MAG: beta strand repeat-containing protein, partial [Planctomycetota bacterium]